MKASYRDITRELIRLIEQKAMSAGSFLPTERELQEKFSASRTTVRRALGALVEAGYATNIPNRGVQVRVLSIPEKPITIAFIDGSTSVLKSLFSQLSELALSKGWSLIHINSEIIGLEAALDFARERDCAGAFVWSFEGFPDLCAVNQATEGMAIVQLDHQLRGYEGDLVTLDYFQMSYDLTAHLFNSGCERVAITGMLDMLETTHDRLRGYMKAHFDFGRTPSSADFIFSSTSGMHAPDMRHVLKRFTDEDRPDGLFIMCDDQSPLVVHSVMSLGLSIPQDVKLATIGDDTTVAIGNVGITAIQCHWNHFGVLAFRQMEARLNNLSAPYAVLHAGFDLVPKGSCGENGAETSRLPAGSFVVVQSPRSASIGASAMLSSPLKG